MHSAPVTALKVRKVQEKAGMEEKSVTVIAYRYSRPCTFEDRWNFLTDILYDGMSQPRVLDEERCRMWQHQWKESRHDHHLDGVMLGSHRISMGRLWLWGGTRGEATRRADWPRSR